METESKKPLENFPKIDTIWSEADENFVIKEEIVSDLEPELPISPNEDEAKGTEVHRVTEAENDKCLNDSNNLSILHKKKLKTKNAKGEEIEIFGYNKSFCVHNPKNFKMVKRRLRCGDCRSLVCPECCKVMTPNLSSHFSGSGLNKSDVFVCRYCSIIFHSLCALQAHIRIHSMEIPYVCPDCGLIYNNIHFLILHLQNKCFHVYKTARYKCKNCPGLYFKAESFGQHVQDVHLECVFRCLYCSSLFTNHDEFNYHMSKLHQKQKAQYLNYYRCSLCSNMVIPQFMYAKHIAQHCDNPTLYEINYQCVCGETFNVIGAFRAHTSYCNFKKILPYQWRFLQGKFKTQEASHLDYYHNNVFESANLSSKTSESESGFFKSLTTDIGFQKKSNSMEITGTNKNSDGEGDVCTIEIEGTVETNKSKVIEVIDSEPLKNNLPGLLEIESSSEIEKINKVNSNNVNSEYVKVDMNENMEIIQDSKENGAISKIYDHIPCDHLGYVVKTQCSEGNKKTGQVVCGEIINVENTGNGNYQIVTELDEKTGIVRAKSVPLEKFGNIEEDEEPENQLNEDDTEEKQIENISEKPFSYMPKIKSNMIKCPFCTIMFPKHNLAFQQFKLHIDSNHPDAAVNVIVTSEGNTMKNDISNNQDSEMGDMSSCNDTSKEQSSGASLNSVSFSGKKADGKDGQIDDNDRTLTDPESQTDMKITSPKKLIPENQISMNKIPCSMKKEKIPLFWNVSISINSSDQKRAEEYKESLKSGACNNFQGDNEGEIGFENKEVEVQREKTSNSENRNLVDEETAVNDELIENLKSLQSTEIATEETDCVNVPSELDGEGEGSKNSSRSSVSVSGLMSDKEPKTDEKEKEKSRRESEVWSELYESLMLAEKLKKKKLPPDSEGKRKLAVSDYSSKRIVKKPKRYGESSDSGESSENSDFDEFLIDNDLFEKMNSEGADSEKTDKDGLTKKQKLLVKLENVDGRLADYLLDLITKKEKMFELYKKHSIPRAGHDLRSYRKKVLNGIKHRGRPFKIFRCDDSLNEKYPMQVDRTGKECNKKGDYCPGSKVLEKKRGRPRKYQEAKIKERRRSDKEVSFIEKNFEQDENELSPSKRKRKLSSKLQYYKNLSDEKDDFSSGQVITNKAVDANKKFTCAVCKQTFLELNEFRDHIIEHRTEENTYQCMECGECFVVRPSLEKHLHAFHKIRNTDKYIMDNECCNIKKEEAEEEPLKENQCKVCKDQFDKATDLTKHFRIHGMAFLKEFKKDGRLK